MRIPKEQLTYFLFLIFLVMAGQFGIDLYLASMPAITKSLQTSASMLKLTIPLYLLGFAISQLMYGPISDAHGRKSILYIGLSLFLVGSLGCLFAINAPMLIAFRTVQGLGAGAGIVATRSIMRDVFHGKMMAKVSAMVSMLWSVIPMVAPVIGGYIQEHGGWRVNFVVMSIYAALTLIAVGFFLKETLSEKHQHPVCLPSVILRYKRLISNRTFMAFSLMSSLCSAYFLSFITASPFLLQEHLKQTPVQYGWSILSVAIGGVIGSKLCTWIVHHFRIVNILCTGVLIQLSATLILFLLSIFDFINIRAIILPMFVSGIAAGLIFPNCTTGAMTPYKHKAGMAGATFGSIQMFMGFFFSFIISHLPTNTATPLSIELLTISVIIAVLFFTFVRPNFEEEH